MTPQKKHHVINIRIPIKLWDKVEKTHVKEKQKMPSRKYTQSDYLNDLISSGLDNGNT